MQKGTISRGAAALLAAWALGSLACSGAPQSDGGPEAATDASALDADSSAPDAATRDSALDAESATAEDAAEEPAASADAGPEASDAAQEAAALEASADGGLGPVGLCVDTLAQVYFTPLGLPPFALSERGNVVRCAPDRARTQAEVQSGLSGAGVAGVTASTGVREYRIAYRTARAPGLTEGASTARVYVPATPVALPMPLVVVTHGSEGLADNCATSRNLGSLEDLALPWAALGYAVIAPDYAGLGNEGTQGYLDNRDTGYSTLDAARALRRFLPAGTFESRVVFAGHSQGGGAALSAQALASTYGCDGTPAAVVVFAAEWETRLNSFNLLNALANPDALTIAYGITTPTVTALEAYAFLENRVAAGSGGLAFPAASRDTMVNAIQNQCLVVLGGIQQAAQLHVRDWLTPELRTGLLACASAASPDAGVADAAAGGCTGVAQTFYDYLRNNILPGDPRGAPVLYLQGLTDLVMPPAQEAACNVAKLRSDGVDVTACTDGPATHTSVIPRNVAFGIRWTQSLLAGALRPPCAASALPACTP